MALLYIVLTYVDTFGYCGLATLNLTFIVLYVCGVYLTLVKGYIFLAYLLNLTSHLRQLETSLIWKNIGIWKIFTVS